MPRPTSKNCQKKSKKNRQSLNQKLKQLKQRRESKMTDDVKLFMMQSLREKFSAFTQEMLKIPGSIMQKQQAFYRFDEGHMWMQNAVLSYQPPQQEEAPQTETIQTETVHDVTPEGEPNTDVLQPSNQEHIETQPETAAV
jgi:hypothetical protein